MCQDCGCGLKADKNTASERHPGQHLVAHPDSEPVLRALLEDNDRFAAHNRRHLESRGITAINLMSSPGAGKTRLLEATIDALKHRYRMAVIEGDLETENDARRIRERGVPAVQITTGTACHLDASMVHGAVHELDLEQLDLLFIENVGNLVCPASFDLGQHFNVVLLSVPEGDDKPAKYPVIFRAADLVAITKSDLLPHMREFRPPEVRECLRKLAVATPVLELSAQTGEGLEPWLDWVVEQTDAVKQAAPAAIAPHAHVPV